MPDEKSAKPYSPTRTPKYRLRISYPETPRLTDEEFSTLLQEARNGSHAARDKIIMANIPLVTIASNHYGRRTYHFEDLYQEGVYGLIKAVDNFDPSLGNKFSTYAMSMISGRMLHFLREDRPIHVKRSAYYDGVKVVAAIDRIWKQTGAEPTAEEVAQTLSMDVQSVRDALDAIADVSSLSDPVDWYDDCGKHMADIGETISDPEQTTERWVQIIELRDAINSLPPMEKAVIEMTFYDDMDQYMIADALHTKRSNVAYFKQQALKHMRKYMGIEEPD